MLASFPMLLPERLDDSAGEAWHGLLQVGQRNFRLRVLAEHAAIAKPPAPVPPAPSAHALPTVLAVETARIEAAMAAAAPPRRRLLLQGEPDLVKLLTGYQNMLEQRWQQSADLHEFLLELQEIISRLLRTAPPPSDDDVPPLSSLPSTAHFVSLFEDVEQLPGGWACVKDMDPKTARTLQLVIVDRGQREHIMHVKMPDDYPLSQPLVRVDLPVPFAIADGAEAHSLAASSAHAVATAAPSGALVRVPSLRAAFARFSALVSSCQLFFDAMADLAAHSWILEPEAPIPLSSRARRVAVAQSCWLEMDVPDPLHPLVMPHFRLLGNEKKLEPLEASVAARLREWAEPSAEEIAADPVAAASSLRRNLLHLLGLDAFPLSTDDDKGDSLNLECAICWSYHLPAEEGYEHADGEVGAAPDWVCPNGDCARAAHMSCIRRSLQTLSTSKQAFGNIYGQCFNCKEPISVPLM